MRAWLTVSHLCCFVNMQLLPPMMCGMFRRCDTCKRIPTALFLLLLLTIPTGTYNDQIRPTKTDPCTDCPTGRSTFQTGGSSVSDCSVCVGGYGGSDCSGRCGGGRGLNATYGAPGRTQGADCDVCLAITNGFTFYYRGNQSSFVPAVVSRLGAESSADCLAEFAQINDAAWFLGGTARLNKVNNIASFNDCVESCRTTATCQYASYNYEASLAADNVTFVPECLIKTANMSAPR